MVKAVACCVLLGLVVAGCGAASNTGSGGVQISGATDAQRDVLRSILDRMGATGITKLTIAPAGSDFQQTSGRPELFAEYDQSDPLASWEGNLVAGAFNDEASARGAEQIVAFKDGVQGEEGRLAPGGATSGAPPPLERMRTELTEAVQRQGGRLVDLRVFTVDHLAAAAAIVATDQPAEFVLERAPVIDAALQRAGMAGTYLEVRDGSGAPALQTYDVAVGGMGLWSTGPKGPYEGCGPDHSYPAGMGPAPCPFDGPRVEASPGVLPRLDAPAVRRIAAVARPTVVGVGREGDIVSMCREAGVEDCPGVPASTLAWVVAGPSGWAVVDDATGKVLGSG